MSEAHIIETQSLDFAEEILTTPDLVLRAPNKDDVADIARLANNRNISSMLGSMPYPYYEQDAEQFVQKVSNPDAGSHVFAITHIETGEFMGICGLHLEKRRFELPYIGYWLGEDYWGKGYATQAARALVDLFFKTGSEDKMLVTVLSNNDASRRVIEKCGGQFWKRGMDHSAYFGKDMEVDHFQVTRENWMGTIAA